MKSTRIIFGALVLFVVCALASGFYTNFLQGKITTAQAQIDSLAVVASEAALDADAIAHTAAAALMRARAAEHTRDSALAGLKQRRAHADTVIAEAPDTCAPVIAALDALAGSYLEALHVEIEQHDSTKAALSDAQAGLADAQRALAGLSVKAGEIELPRASWLGRLLPQTGVGVAAGLDPQGKFHVVAGITLGWKVSL